MSKRIVSSLSHDIPPNALLSNRASIAAPSTPIQSSPPNCRLICFRVAFKRQQQRQHQRTKRLELLLTPSHSSESSRSRHCHKRRLFSSLLQTQWYCSRCIGPKEAIRRPESCAMHLPFSQICNCRGPLVWRPLESRGDGDREWNGQRDGFILVLPYVSRPGLLFVSAFPYLAACFFVAYFSLYFLYTRPRDTSHLSLFCYLLDFLIPSCT